MTTFGGWRGVKIAGAHSLAGGVSLPPPPDCGWPPYEPAPKLLDVVLAEFLDDLHRYVCPECQQGKHGNCDGRGGFDEDDLPVPCACYVDGHPTP